MLNVYFRHKKAALVQDSEGNLPIHYAVKDESPNVKVVKSLLKNHKATLFITNNMFRTPMDYMMHPDYNQRRKKAYAAIINNIRETMLTEEDFNKRKW